MNETLVTAKAALAAFFAALASFLGWKGIMALAWVALMAVDYISGTLAARHKGEWKSRIAREGLWHKGGMILVVLVAAVADIVLSVVFTNMPVLEFAWPGVILPLVLAWYIITELGSILENAVKFGAKVPSWMIKLLDGSKKAVEHVGEMITEQNEYKAEDCYEDAGEPPDGELKE